MSMIRVSVVGGGGGRTAGVRVLSGSPHIIMTRVNLGATALRDDTQDSRLWGFDTFSGRFGGPHTKYGKTKIFEELKNLSTRKFINRIDEKGGFLPQFDSLITCRKYQDHAAKPLIASLVEKGISTLNRKLSALLLASHGYNQNGLCPLLQNPANREVEDKLGQNPP